MTTATKSKTNGSQKEFAGMPKRVGVAKTAFEWMERQARINQLESKQAITADEIIAGLKKENKPFMKIQDPDTKEFREFKINRSHDKLQVRKVQEKVGKQR